MQIRISFLLNYPTHNWLAIIDLVLKCLPFFTNAHAHLNIRHNRS